MCSGFQIYVGIKCIAFDFPREALQVRAPRIAALRRPSAHHIWLACCPLAWCPLACCPLACCPLACCTTQSLFTSLVSCGGSLPTILTICMAQTLLGKCLARSTLRSSSGLNFADVAVCAGLPDGHRRAVDKPGLVLREPRGRGAPGADKPVYPIPAAYCRSSYCSHTLSIVPSWSPRVSCALLHKCRIRYQTSFVLSPFDRSYSYPSACAACPSVRAVADVRAWPDPQAEARDALAKQPFNCFISSIYSGFRC